ncbi:MAG: ATP-binding protein [Gammaproteobacteria bacterium]|nr:ATP-binding protein [Gammaproteobacteria bacterium]MDJ0873508.1 ATP-binding protein [Gammaproteobacteria bacterium]MDJ0890167.1 ATP-binding protein [Gammaproteobacteria bacterium]
MTGGSVSPPTLAKGGELEDAFAVFSEMSNELVAAYRLLEDKVVQLNHELAQARDERRLELQQKERLASRLGLLLEALPGGVVLLDANGIVQECNPAARELLGEPLHGDLWRDVVARAFTPRPDDGHDVSLRSGRRVNIATCSLGAEPGQVLLINDVTETRRLQEQLSQLRRLSAMGEMAASLAHQVRTPLASALLYAGNLGRTDLEPDARQRFGDKLRGVLGHLEKLVKDMLSFARKGSFAVEDVSMRDLESGLRQMLETGMERTTGEYELRNSAGDCTIQGNREALVSACRNLVENAIQSGGDVVHVGIHLSRPSPTTVEIRVADDGQGISPEVRERLFDPFFTTRSGGTGLGLSVVQAVVQSHGGTVTVDSEPGKGSSFSLQLPVQSHG